MIKLSSLLVLLVVGFWPVNCHANHIDSNDILVVTHIDTNQLNLRQIKKVYLGMNVSSGGSNTLFAVTLPSKSDIRQLFNVKVIGLSEARIKSFWAQMRFSGRGKPPIELKDSKMIIKYLIDHPGSIGYLSSQTPMPPQLKVIYSSDKH